MLASQQVGRGARILRANPARVEHRQVNCRPHAGSQRIGAEQVGKADRLETKRGRKIDIGIKIGVRRVAPLLFDFEELSGRWPDSPEGRTRREIYARRHGMTIFRGQGRPKPELTAEAIEQIVRAAPRPNFSA